MLFETTLGSLPLVSTEESYGSKSLKGMNGSHNLVICVHIDFL